MVKVAKLQAITILFLCEIAKPVLLVHEPDVFAQIEDFLPQRAQRSQRKRKKEK
jgi:hypothetical protein